MGIYDYSQIFLFFSLKSNAFPTSTVDVDVSKVLDNDMDFDSMDMMIIEALNHEIDPTNAEKNQNHPTIPSLASLKTRFEQRLRKEETLFFIS